MEVGLLGLDVGPVELVLGEVLSKVDGPFEKTPFATGFTEQSEGEGEEEEEKEKEEEEERGRERERERKRKRKRRRGRGGEEGRREGRNARWQKEMEEGGTRGTHVRTKSSGGVVLHPDRPMASPISEMT
jgi:hypothetical protein